jgi:hypothetical protein
MLFFFFSTTKLALHRAILDEVSCNIGTKKKRSRGCKNFFVRGLDAIFIFFLVSLKQKKQMVDVRMHVESYCADFGVCDSRPSHGSRQLQLGSRCLPSIRIVEERDRKKRF